MVSFQYGFCATQGKRGYQEDAAAVWPSQVSNDTTTPETTFNWSLDSLPEARCDGIVAVLADGMGGHVGGAQASQVLCEAFIQSWVAQIADGYMPAEESEAMNTALRAALQAGNARIKETIQADPALSGMGSTLVGVVFYEKCLQWISVGDSPLYLYRREDIALLNEDHSLAPALDKLANEGKISAEQAMNDPSRHMLRSAVMGEGIDLIDVSRRPLNVEKDDYIIIASDGIHTLSEQELARLIHACGADGPHAVSQTIIRAIEDAGHPYQDNATVIAVQIVA